MEENEKFKISTPTSVAGVRGTEFLVVEENGKCKISCVGGTVAVKDAKGDDSSFIDVENGKAASIESGKPIAVDELTEEEINNINKIKDDILRNKEEKKVSGKPAANVEAKDATKIQAEAIKGEDKI